MVLSNSESNILVAYFSHTGNTRVLANQIHESIGGNIFEIVAVNPYPGEYNAVVKQARDELNARYMPKLNSKVGNLEAYSVVFVGNPNWWGTNFKK